MMGWQTGDQRQLFYLFNLERRIPASHLLRRINPIVMQVLADLREKLAPFYSDIGRPSIDPELMIRMLIVGLRCQQRAHAPQQTICMGCNDLLDHLIGERE
jgi:transposase